MVLTVAAFAFASAVFAETVPATEYSARRARVAQAIGANSILILTSPEAAVRNNDVDYPFRQDDNLYYLTGIY